MATMTTTHPSREEWKARQAALPPAAWLKLREAADAAEVRAAEATAAFEKRERDAAQWRADYETAIAAALVEAGAAWLAGWRVRDCDRDAGADPERFDLATRAFGAKFDARAWGVWPVYLMLRYCEREEWGGEGWRHNSPSQPWTVAHPGDTRSFANFADALEFATRPAGVPF